MADCLECAAGTNVLTEKNMTMWRDQVALVTGGSRGIGRATARLLAQRGAAVCLHYATHADAADGLDIGRA
jgi:NAD(P)-dependent dehydrogenase (short-subunit alcohol dehydrogenase family)